MQILFFCLLAISCFAIDIARPDQSSVTAYFHPKEGEYPILVYIQGGEKRAVLPDYELWKERAERSGFALVAIEKRGIFGKEGIVDAEYDMHHSLQSRYVDYIALVKALEREKPSGWNGHFVWLGVGDGGELAAMLAKEVGRTEGVILIGTGGGASPLEEQIALLRARLFKEHAALPFIKAATAKFVEEWRGAMENPSPTQFLLGQSYRYWASRAGRGEDPLKEVKAPLCIIHAKEDPEVLISSAERRVKELRKEGLALQFILQEGEKGDLEAAFQWLEGIYRS